jgi:hypothetical protein
VDIDVPIQNVQDEQRSIEAQRQMPWQKPGFTFGLDIVLFVGQRRLREHQPVDEIHQSLLEQLVPLDQTISRREILFLFEAYTALLRAGTEVTHDEGWKEQIRRDKGIVLSIDGIQKDQGQ